MRWTEDQYEEYLRKRQGGKVFAPQKNKYNNKKTIVDGIAFDSKMEARYYQNLKLLQEAGEITAIELQPKFELLPTFTKNGVTHRAITYTADFKVMHNDGRVEIVDVKGHETQVFRIKRKLFEKKYPELELKIV